MQTPERFVEQLKRCGSNLYGEPFWRLVWSEDRLEYFYGEQKRKYGDGKDRWILEKWCPPEQYGSRQTWEETKDWETGQSILGEFPSRGDYEHSFTFDSDGVFIQPTEQLLDLLIRCINAGKMHTRSQRWAAIKEAKEKSEREYKERFSQIFDEAQGPFGENAVSGIPSKRRPEDVRLDLTTADLPPSLPRHGAKQINPDVLEKV